MFNTITVLRNMITCHQLSYLLCCALIVGCASNIAAPNSQTDNPAQREPALLLLDNHGGFSHAGRRIALHSAGDYSDTSYTDVVGGDQTIRGTYTLDAHRTNLILLPAHGEAEHLYRVDYGRQQYWVREQERQRITEPN